MATIPQTKPKKRTDEELVTDLHKAIEEHFDALGLTKEERDKEYADMERSLNARDAARARR